MVFGGRGLLELDMMWILNLGIVLFVELGFIFSGGCEVEEVGLVLLWFVWGMRVMFEMGELDLDDY